ncbi:NAD(P)-dependent dehydrogenase (short-subunit alcohol dehydrogenase family) [Neisseria perflava]|uniref:SDR family oxidoreductase n=1 Tax=Neisseria perflava TaxID=33053 RepID=UPI0020A21643|nr:SDR family oxidoreductase [Neisseria perflava]MCP1773269.1 NAD(P)-dependent dehydrogenase (short-subunit alcohol dehydrogenase family) [Neisseria perflava]
MNKKVTVVIGSGSIAITIARRVSVGNHVLVADIRQENAEAAAKTLREAGFECSTAQVDVASRESVQALADQAAKLGDVYRIINTAGRSPSQASPADILKADLYGTALVLDIFGEIVAEGGSALMTGSQSAFRLEPLSAEDIKALAITPTEELLDLPIVKAIDDSLRAYQISKRCNALRVQAQAVYWGDRGARVNCISPGIIFTPLALDELTRETRGEFYRNMLASIPARRGGSPDEVAELAAVMMNSGYITGSDFLIDGGATAKFWYGEV